MKSRNIIIALLLILAGSLTLSAQSRNTRRHAAPPKKVPAELICKKLQLSDAQARQFTPLYNEYRDRMAATLHKYPTLPPGRTVPDSIDDSRLQQFQLNRLRAGKEIMQIRIDYYPRFRKILTPRQIEKLNSCEEHMHKNVNREHNHRAERQKR